MGWKLLLVICAVAAFNTGVNADPTSVLGDEPRHREKRNLAQFGLMITAITGRNPLDYNDYGCYCGSGGSGTPVDDIDKCCQAHDACYDSVSSPKVTTYAYSTAQGAITCLDAPGSNEWLVCECDMAAVLCFNRHVYTVKKTCPMDCNAPQNPANTNRNGCNTPFIHGEVCNYVCRAGSTEVGGGNTLTCNNGSWVGNPLVCIVDCNVPPNPANTNRNGCNPPYIHGEVCNYVCIAGSRRVAGDNTLTCNKGAWVGNPLDCKMDCNAPQNPANTNRNGCNAPFIHGDVCNYVCKAGFIKVGGGNMLSCNDGNWVGNPLVCVATPFIPVDCNAPPNPANTNRNGCNAPYIHGEVCNYVCKAGSRPFGGGNMLTCNNGAWIGNLLDCKMDCNAPQNPANTNRNGCNAPFIHGDVCNYVCKAGFIEVGGGNILTCNDGNWVGNPLVCAGDCNAPPNPANTNRNGCNAPYMNGDVCNYVCKAGSRPFGGDNMLTCNNGAWVGNPLDCKMDCNAPQNPANTNRNGCNAPFIHGDVCNYVCKAGSTEVGGDNILTCNDGNWVGNPLACAVDCDAPPAPLINSDRNGCAPPYVHGEVCNYECDVGYSIDSGDYMLTCNNGVWVGIQLVCKKDCYPPPAPLINTDQNGCAPPYRHLDECDYVCDAGYSRDSGAYTLICFDGDWLGEELVCKEDCIDNPPDDPPCTIRDCDLPFTHGEVCNYQCDIGCTQVAGDNALTCHDGGWAWSPIDCRMDCDGPPPNSPNANRKDCTAPYTHGEVCNYECDDGYSKDSGDDWCTCDDGIWRGEILVCEKDCDPPPNPDNTDRTDCADPYIHKEECNYACKDGFSKDSGDNTLTCNDGAWTGNPLVCKATTTTTLASTGAPTTSAPTTAAPTTAADTTAAPTTAADTTAAPTTAADTTAAPTTAADTTAAPTTAADTTAAPTTAADTTAAPTTAADTTAAPTTAADTTAAPTTAADTTAAPTTAADTTAAPTTELPTTEPPTTEPPTTEPRTTEAPATEPPTTEPPTTEPLTTTDVPPNGPTNDQCSVDLIFLIDGSSSIGRDGFERAKEYISYIIGCFSNGDINVGVIQYECTPKVDIPLGSYMDTVGLQDSILNDVVFSGGQARTGAAIRCMTSATPFREQARKVAVVATDGGKQAATVAYDPEEYVEYADEARAAGIELWAIATGRDFFINGTALAIISGDPSRVVSLDLDNPCDVAAKIEQCAP